MARILLKKSATEAKRPPMSDLSLAGQVMVNYNDKQPALLFGSQDPATQAISDVISGPPFVGITAPTLLSGDSYLNGQMWLQPRYSRGADLKIWWQTNWVDTLANGLAGYTSSLTPNKPIGAQVSLLGWGDNDPPFDSTRATALGFNSYGGGIPRGDMVAIGNDVGIYLKSVQGQNIMVGPGCGGSVRSGGGVTSIQDSILVGRNCGTWVKSATVKSCVWIGSNMPFGDSQYEQDKPVSSWSSSNDVFLCPSASRESSFPDERLPVPFFQATITDAGGGDPLGNVTTSDNVILSSGSDLYRTYTGSSTPVNFNLTKNAILGSIVTRPGLSESVSLSYAEPYSRSIPSTYSVSVLGGVSGYLDFSTRNQFVGVPSQYSVVFGNRLAIGTKPNAGDVATITFKWGSDAYPTQSYVNTTSDTGGAIFFGDYTLRTAYTGLKNPIFFTTNGVHRWVISGQAWSFNGPIGEYEPLTPNYGKPGQVLQSKGPNARPEWVSPAGATGTFQLDSGETVFVENGFITSIS